MARKFTKSEKSNIENELIETSKQLFATFGYQKTSIQNITKRVGIAQGTFYHFFSSKESLYFRALEREEEELRENIFTFQPDASLSAEEKLRQILQYIVDRMSDSALLRQFFAEDHVLLMRTIDKKKLKQHMLHDEQAMKIFISHLEKEQIYVTESAEVVASLLRSLFILFMQREEIGNETFDITIERLIRYIAAGLVRKE